MIDIVVEIATNLFQSVLFIGFFYFFFDRCFSKKWQLIGLFSFILLLFAATTFFSFYRSFLNVNDMWIYIAIMELYVLIFLKGNIFVRLIMPLIAFFINTVITHVFAYSVSYFTGESYYELALESTVYRYLCIVLINATNLLVFFLLLKFKSKNFSLTRWTDVTTFIVIPLLSMVIIYATFYVLVMTNYREDILAILTVICLCMIAVAVIVWLMMSRISKDNEIKTKLLLVEQKERLYESNIMQVNKQIEAVAKIKHDMKNNLLCISELIAREKYKDAESFCRNITENMAGIYTPVNTQNHLLNAVINVELEKASALGIDFVLTLNDELPEFLNNFDIVSIIGNLCDNAIEYLQTVPADNRKMKLEISRHNSYCIINCKNRIISSVLESNPALKTSKSRKTEHGKGIEILRSNADKYDGELDFSEKDGYFSASMVLKMST